MTQTRSLTITLIKAGLLVTILFVLTDRASAQTGYPEVSFDYGYVPFDRACSDLTNFEIDKAWIEELESRKHEFEAAWKATGPKLLETVIAETGKPFRQHDVMATMSLCKFPSMSHPLLLNMRRFLDSASEGEPREKHMFVALVFHELLHKYVTEHRGETAMLRKYKNEPFSVKSHIHLMALMKMAYLNLGLEKELEDIVERDRKLARPVYLRSWEIVNEIEGFQVFVDEMKG